MMDLIDVVNELKEVHKRIEKLEVENKRFRREKEELILVPDEVGFRRMYGTVGMLFNHNKQFLMYSKHQGIFQVLAHCGIWEKPKLKLTKCKFEDVEIGEWFLDGCLSDIRYYRFYELKIENDHAVWISEYGSIKREKRFSDGNCYKVEQVEEIERQEDIENGRC